MKDYDEGNDGFEFDLTLIDTLSIVSSFYLAARMTLRRISLNDPNIRRFVGVGRRVADLITASEILKGYSVSDVVQSCVDVLENPRLREAIMEFDLREFSTGDHVFNGPTGVYFHLTSSFQYRNLNAIGKLFFTCGLYDLGMEVVSVLDSEFMFRAAGKLQSVLDPVVSNL